MVVDLLGDLGEGDLVVGHSLDGAGITLGSLDTDACTGVSMRTSGLYGVDRSRREYLPFTDFLTSLL